MRKMLDELMGTQRDGVQEKDSVKFTSPTVCKSYLLGLCPFDLFHNTKLDLGACSKIHDPALKADYELSMNEKDYGYEIEQLDHLTQFISDCDRKVGVNKRRLEETQDEESLGPEALAVHELNEQIGIMLAEAEVLGADGMVDDSMRVMAEIDVLKGHKRKAEDIYRNSIAPTTNQQQKLRVCEICAAFLSLYDNDRRLADHFGGRLHMGFIKVRERLTQLQDVVTKKRENRELERMKRREEREQERERERKERNKVSDRSRDRNRRSRSRDNDRKDRHKEKDRHRRSRSRDRKRDKSRDKSRDRSKRDRRSRSRSRDRHSSKDRRDNNGDKRSKNHREGSRDKNKDDGGVDSMEEGEVKEDQVEE